MPRPRLAYLALLLALGACASAEEAALAAGGRALYGPEVAALVADRTLSGIEGFTGAAIGAYHGADGGLEVRRAGGTSQGRWWVDERARLCWLEAAAAAAGPLCRRMLDRAGLYQMFEPDGALGFTVARIDRGREGLR